MNFEQPEQEVVNTTEEERRSFDRLLSEYGLDITDLYISGLNNNLEISPGRYATNDGVIVANIEGKIIAIPYNDKTIDWVRHSELREDESVGVPALNNVETWGEKIDALNEWRKVHQKFNN